MLLCLPGLQPLAPAFHPRTKVAALTCPKFSYSPAVSPRTAVTFTDSSFRSPDHRIPRSPDLAGGWPSPVNPKSKGLSRLNPGVDITAALPKMRTAQRHTAIAPILPASPPPDRVQVGRARQQHQTHFT